MTPADDVTATLPAILRQIAERASRLRGQHIGEQNTKATLIEPVLRALGWNVEDLDEVRREYRRRPQDKPVDYALLLLRDPALFIEAKALGENLADRRWANQVVSYASVAGVGWVVLSDGDEYRIYNAHAPVPVDEKLFRSARITADPDDACAALTLLAKDQMRQNALAGLWQVENIDRQVRRAVEEMFSPEPSAWLVRRLSQQLDGLTAGDIRAALSRARLSLDFPSASGDAPAPRPQPRRTGRPGPQGYGVSLKDMIESGILKPPLELRKTYLGRDLSARVELDGRVTFARETYNSPSVAAGVARASVRGAPAGRKYLQTNGWTFWHFRDSDDEWKELDVLRQRHLERASHAATMSRTVSRDEKDSAPATESPDTGLAGPEIAGQP
jgi:Restriction Enzyme Adenine Methylase Associated